MSKPTADQDPRASAGAVDPVERRLAAQGASCDDVAAIASAIEAMASETNLLALGGALAAARAVGNGQRFAPVASEVKALAEQTLDATLKIAATIGTLPARSPRR